MLQLPPQRLWFPTVCTAAQCYIGNLQDLNSKHRGVHCDLNRIHEEHQQDLFLFFCFTYNTVQQVCFSISEDLKEHFMLHCTWNDILSFETYVYFIVCPVHCFCNARRAVCRGQHFPNCPTPHPEAANSSVVVHSELLSFAAHCLLFISLCR